MTTLQKIQKYMIPGGYPNKHASQVVGILKLVTDDPEVVIAGCYHDVLEDTDVTRAELEAIAGKRATDLVWEVTKTGPSEFKNLKTRDAFLIKYADRLSNLSNLPFRKYKKIGIQPYLDKSVFWKT